MKFLKSKFLRKVSILVFALLVITTVVFLKENPGKVSGTVSDLLTNKFCDNPAEPLQKNCTSFIQNVLAQTTTSPYTSVDGPITMSGTVEQGAGYVYLGKLNSAFVRPRPITGSVGDLAIGWNFSGGLRDMDLWNTDVYNTQGISFSFKQLTSATTHNDLVNILPNGTLDISAVSAFAPTDIAPRHIRLGDILASVGGWHALGICSGGAGTGPTACMGANEGIWYWGAPNATGAMDDNMHLATNGNLAIRGTLSQGSSRELKKDINYLSQDQNQGILKKALETKIVTYKYKGEDENTKPHIGVIAEESPDEITGDDKKSIRTSDYLAFLLASIQAQQKEIESLQKQVEELQRK